MKLKLQVAIYYIGTISTTVAFIFFADMTEFKNSYAYFPLLIVVCILACFVWGYIVGWIKPYRYIRAYLSYRKHGLTIKQSLLCVRSL